MLEAPVAKTLAELTVPMIFGMLSMVLYNMADTYFVGQLGKEQLAATSFTFPVVMTINSLSLGIGMGAAAAISRAIGSRDTQRVRRLATDSLVLGLLIITCGVVLGLLTLEPLFSLLGAHGQILKYTGEYMRIWYLGMIFVAYKTLDGLKNYLKDIPRESTLTWSPGCERFGNEPLIGSQEEMAAFMKFCDSIGIKFILVSSG